MAYVIGVDEAGYGPNLGPLVVASSYWQLTTNHAPATWQRAFHVAWNSPSSKQEAIAIDDSKKLFSGARDLAKLESVALGCLAALSTGSKRQSPSRSANGALAGAPSTWAELCSALHTHAATPRDFDAARVRLPLTTQPPDHFQTIADRWRQAEEQAGVRLRGLQCSVVFPREWNALLDRWDNKSTVLSRISLSLVANILNDAPGDAPVQILCDKHGGRNHYAGLLSDSLAAGSLLTPIQEGHDASEYRFQRGKQGLQIGFYRKGESFLPVALASMVAKYVREVAMVAFNSFWRQHLPHLKPTAGYPVDAKRFASEVGKVRQSLKIDEREFWRTK